MAERDSEFRPIGERHYWLPFVGLPRNPGRAWVLVSARHPLRTRWPGDRPPLREMLRTWRYAYPVDITRHSFKSTCQLPCKSDAFFFEADVELTCSVHDPVRVVRRGDGDLWRVLWPLVRQVMRATSRRFPVEQSAEAEAALERAVQDGPYDLGVRVDQVMVDIRLDERAKAHLRRRQDVEWAKAIEELERQRVEAQVNYYKPFVQDERWRLLALHVSGTPADAAEVSRQVVQQQHRELVEQLALLNTMLREDDLELFQLEPETRSSIQQLAGRLKQDLDRLDGSRTRRGTSGD